MKGGQRIEERAGDLNFLLELMACVGSLEGGVTRDDTVDGLFIDVSQLTVR